MKKEQEKEENYVFTTSVDYSVDQDEFIVELFSCPEDEKEGVMPKKVIHNFDELISFFENLDEESNRKLTVHHARLLKKK
jgi:hypothetical protein